MDPTGNDSDTGTANVEGDNSTVTTRFDNLGTLTVNPNATLALGGTVNFGNTTPALNGIVTLDQGVTINANTLTINPTGTLTVDDPTGGINPVFTINANLTVNGGTLILGDGTASQQLVVNGTVNLTGGATLQDTIGGNGALVSDELVASQVELTGVNLDVNVTATLPPSSASVTLIYSTIQALDGVFATVNITVLRHIGGKHAVLRIMYCREEGASRQVACTGG